MSFQVKKFTSIMASMINWISSSTSKITDFNKGSVVRTLLEAVAMELEELYYQLLKATEEAIEEAIYRTFNFPRNPAQRSTGTVRFTRLTGTEEEITIAQGSLIGTATEPPVVFETQAGYIIPGITGLATLQYKYYPDGITPVVPPYVIPFTTFATDSFYIGYGAKFPSVTFTVSIPNDVDVSSLSAVYWNGAWTPLPISADTTTVGGKTLAQTGVITFSLVPVDWVSSAAATGAPALDHYWIRIRANKALKSTTQCSQISCGSGSTTSLIDITRNFVTDGIIVGSKVINETDSGETQSTGVLSFSTTTNTNDTLNFLALTGGASFAGGGDSYKVIVPYKDCSVRALISGVGGNVSANSIVELRSNIPNVLSVNNSSSFSDGCDEESDLSRKVRFALYIQSLARATRAALEYAARTVDQVVAAYAVDDVRPNVFVYDYGTPGTWTDITQAMRNPGDAGVDLFPVSQEANDCLYIGGEELFEYINMHLTNDGITVAPDIGPLWEYYSTTGWKTLAVTDGTDNGTGPLTQNGAISWTIPSDWIASTVNGCLRLWIRLRCTYVTSTYSSVPEGDYCSLPPGLGYVYLYCHDGSGELSASLKSAVEIAVESYRGCGIIVEVKEPTKIEPTITVEIMIAENYDDTNICTKVKQAIIDYLNAMVLGEDLYLADLYRLIMDLNSKAILNCHIIVPASGADIIVPASGVIRADEVLITVSSV